MSKKAKPVEVVASIGGYDCAACGLYFKKASQTPGLLIHISDSEFGRYAEFICKDCLGDAYRECLRILNGEAE